MLLPTKAAALPTCFGLEPTYGCKVNGEIGLCLGTNERDRIRGTDGDDVIIGMGGRDYLNGRSGDDTICGGAGNDRIRGGRGNDRISGDGDIEEPIVLPPPPLLEEAGHTIPRAALRQHDIPSECLPTDDPATDAGDDKISGQKDDDECKGGPGDDRCSGGHGNDKCEMGEGDDRCSGGKGDDVCDPGTGADRCNGGGGHDVCAPKGLDDPPSKGCEDETLETCSDGIMNQGEWGIDCGPPCDDAPCGAGGVCGNNEQCVDGACDWGIECQGLICVVGVGSAFGTCTPGSEGDEYCKTTYCNPADYCPAPFDNVLGSGPDCPPFDTPTEVGTTNCDTLCIDGLSGGYCGVSTSWATYKGTGRCIDSASPSPPERDVTSLPADEACDEPQHGIVMRDVLDEHNRVRASLFQESPPEQQLQPLQWSNTLAARAQAWANKCEPHGAGIKIIAHHPQKVCSGAPGELPGVDECDADSDCPAAQTCGGSGIGENIAGYFVGGTKPTDMWASEECCYTPGSTVGQCFSGQQCQSGCNNPGWNGPNNTCGHYTQLVWRDTTHVGCGIADCSHKTKLNGDLQNKDDLLGTYVVCQYWPAGNNASQQPY